MPRHLATATNERIGPVTRPDVGDHRNHEGLRVGRRQRGAAARRRRWLGLTWARRGQVCTEQARTKAAIWTAHELGALATGGWQVLSHVPLEPTNVDHVLAGPGGFYAMTAAYRSDWACEVADLAEAATPLRRAAHSLHSRMNLGRRPVHAVMVMWGPGAEQVAESHPEIDGVTLLEGTSLAAWVRARPIAAGPAVIEQAMSRLHDHVVQQDETERAELARRS